MNRTSLIAVTGKSQVDDVDVCCRDYMDRFLDEHESPATMDRVSLPAVSAADCEQVSGQQHVSGFPTDDDKSCSQVHDDGEPDTLHDGDRDVKLNVSNGKSLTVANGNKVVLPSSDLSADEPVADGPAVDVSVKSYTDADASIAHADAADSQTNVASNSETNTSTPLLSSCPTAHAETVGNSHIEEMESERLDTGNSESASATTALEKQKSSSDADGVILEPSETAVLSSSATTVTVHDQQSVSEAHAAGNHPTAMSATPDREPSSNTVVQESHAVTGSATASDVDEVKPGDVELLLAAVDSAASVAGSMYSNVDPLTAALEFSSSTSISMDLLSNKTDTECTCQQADSFTNSSMQSSSRQTNGHPPESSLLLQSSNSLVLPVSCSVVSAVTSSLPADCSNVSLANTLKHGDGSVTCKSNQSLMSTTPDNAAESMEMPIDERPVAIVPTSTRDISSVNQDMHVLLPDESVHDSRPDLQDEAAVISPDEQDSATEMRNLNDSVQCPEETELASFSSSHSCLESRNISATVSGSHVSNTQAGVTDVKTNSDSTGVSLTLTSDVPQSDTLGDEPDSLDESQQCENVDSRSLLTVPSDTDCTSTAS